MQTERGTTMFQVIGTTPTGERVVFGFGYPTQEAAQRSADRMATERPTNIFTKQPYTYFVQQGGVPDNVVMVNGRPRFRR